MNLKNPKLKRVWMVLAFSLFLFIALYPTSPPEPIHYIERTTGKVKTEKVAGESWLAWLYNNPMGKVTLWTIAKRKATSVIYGKLMDSESSADKIQDFINDYDIDMQVFKEQNFKSFNDFFIREIKKEARPIDTSANVVVSPADGKVLAYQNIKNTDFIIKGQPFNVSSFLDNPTLASYYEDGSMLIIRLAPADYHRYHFPIDGKVIINEKINGDYYSVSPIALRKKVEIFWLNKREYTLINSTIFGDMIMAEVGATMVGSMVQTFKNNKISKGEEKGYFKFGGSTVVLLFKKDEIKIDADLIANTAKGLETTVKVGEKIGEKY